MVEEFLTNVVLGACIKARIELFEAWEREEHPRYYIATPRGDMDLHSVATNALMDLGPRYVYAVRRTGPNSVSGIDLG